MSAGSLDGLAVAGGAIVATFHAGRTAGGHHWTLAAGGEELARTRRVHSGGRLKQAAWKAVTLTGMDAGNDIHAELVSADGAVLARLESANAAPPVVTATGPGGEPVVSATRDGDRLLLDGGVVLHAEGESPWPVTGPGGERLGELLAGAPGPKTEQTWSEMLLGYEISAAGDFARTMHLGLRRVTNYALRTEARPTPALALLPLLAGLTY
jgi:hypothetical protein